MGKVNVLQLNPDMTFKEKKVKTESKDLSMTKTWKPSFVPGRSVFSEIVSSWKFWKKKRNLIIILDKASKAFELHDSKTNELEPNFWTGKETEKFIAKVVAKSKAEQKVISTTHFIIIMIGIAIIVVLQLLMLQGTKILV